MVSLRWCLRCAEVGPEVVTRWLVVTNEKQALISRHTDKHLQAQ
jgi:hypothetical protein